MKISFAVSALLGLTNATVSHSTTECGDSCSPAKCTMVSNEQCSFKKETFDMKEQLEQLPCKQCTQSTDSKCTSANIKSAFTTSQFEAIYCNDKYLVAWSTGAPAHTHGLAKNPRPPGGGGGTGGYDTECVVRTNAEQFQIYKFPITPPTMLKGYTFGTATTLTLAGASGMAKDGVPIYPAQNNRGVSAWDSCEVDYCNAHSGRGEDYHYHGDPFGSKCLYKSSDYSGSHPPLVGYGADGFPIHGRYTTTAQDGLSTDLDTCNGHDHDGLGYHYHANQKSVTSGSNTWTEYQIGPLICWKGDIDTIDNFWQTQGTESQINYDMSKTDPKYCVPKRTDYDQLKPCCGSTNFFAATGNTINTVKDKCASANGCSTTSKYTCPDSKTTGTTTTTATGTDESGSRVKLTIGAIAASAASLFA